MQFLANIRKCMETYSKSTEIVLVWDLLSCCKNHVEQLHAVCFSGFSHLLELGTEPEEENALLSAPTLAILSNRF